MTTEEQIASLACDVVASNVRAGRRIAVAESCTGGLVCGAITDVPGSSAVLDRGFVTYSNDAKMQMLGVHSDVLETFGAVSVATAWAMAQGALAHSNADIAVAITGIAGPDGGSDKKPVGTVVFARAERGGDPEAVTADLKQFGDLGRTEIRRQAVLCALELLLPAAE
jgi:nicotinamide-nucleotide amidase